MAPIPVKLEALEIIALAKIAHHFVTTHISEKNISEFDKVFIIVYDAFSESEIQLQLEHVTNQKLKAALELVYLPLSTALLEMHILMAC